MKPVVVQALKKLLSSRIPSLSKLLISWFGGEPLLALDIIEDVSEHVNSLLKRNKKVDYYVDMTTNAYLLDIPVFNNLTRLGISHFQITFDGTREHHNRKRVLAGGGGTFDRLWSNLINMRNQDREFNIDVRLHIDRENSLQIMDFIKQYEDAFKEDKRFKLFFRPLSCLGGMNDEKLPVLNETEAKVRMEELKKYMVANNINYKVVDGSQRPWQICSASKLNSFIIRSNGNINKCSVALENVLNHVGRLNKDGTIKVELEKILYWGRGLESGNVDELICPLRNLS
jgi:uncharacterized protein